MKKHAKHLAALAFLALIAGPVMADPPADKGQGNDKASQPGQVGQLVQSGNKGAYDDRYDDGGKKNQGDDKSNHGQVVSECNHRANQRNLKGQDRKQWVEWCTEHGQRFAYDNRYWNNDRTCYQKADDRNLSGDKRRAYLHECLFKSDRNRYDPSKYGTYGEPRGKDVLGKGNVN